MLNISSGLQCASALKQGWMLFSIKRFYISDSGEDVTVELITNEFGFTPEAHVLCLLFRFGIREACWGRAGYPKQDS
jgi:hypothetical protein